MMTVKSEKEIRQQVLTNIEELITQTMVLTKNDGIKDITSANMYEVDSPNTYIDEGNNKVNNAQEKFKKLKEMPAAHFWTIGRNKAKAEKTQEVLGFVIDAVDNNALATKALFNNIVKLSKASKDLFALGVMGVAANRIVFNEIKLRLENASKEELNELARKELQNVLDELEKQKSLEDKIQHLSDTIGSDATSTTPSTGLKNEIENLNYDLIATDERINEVNKTIKKEIDNVNRTVRKEIEDANRTVKKEIDNVNRTVKKEIIDVRGFINEKFDDVESSINIKINDVHDIVNNKLKNIESSVNSKIDNVNRRIEENRKETSNVIERITIDLNNLKDKVEKTQIKFETNSSNHSDRLEQLEKKSFFDSKFYKLMVGLSALAAFALSIINHIL